MRVEKPTIHPRSSKQAAAEILFQIEYRFSLYRMTTDRIVIFFHKYPAERCTLPWLWSIRYQSPINYVIVRKGILCLPQLPSYSRPSARETQDCQDCSETPTLRIMLTEMKEKKPRLTGRWKPILPKEHPSNSRKKRSPQKTLLSRG